MIHFTIKMMIRYWLLSLLWALMMFTSLFLVGISFIEHNLFGYLIQGAVAIMSIYYYIRNLKELIYYIKAYGVRRRLQKKNPGFFSMLDRYWDQRIHNEDFQLTIFVVSEMNKLGMVPKDLQYNVWMLSRVYKQPVSDLKVLFGMIDIETYRQDARDKP